MIMFPFLRRNVLDYACIYTLSITKYINVLSFPSNINSECKDFFFFLLKALNDRQYLTYIYIYIYIYIYTRVCVGMIYMFIFDYAYTIYIPKYVHICVCMCVYVCVLMCACVFANTSSRAGCEAKSIFKRD